MKAAQINRYGGISQISLNEIDLPELQDNQVLVKVHAASLNPVDTAVREGYLHEFLPLTFPATLGENFSGVITKVGQDVKDFSVGDEVYGRSSALTGNSGSFAEMVTASTDEIAKKPESTDFIEAAALPLVGSSAIQALEEHMKIKPGQKVLIHGGAGGIGHVAIQLAKLLGAFVATTAGSKSRDFVKTLGADEIIDYKTQDFSESLHDYDAVYDTVGGETTKKSFKILKPGGVLVSMLGEPDQTLAKEFQVTAIGQNTKTTQAHLNRLRELVDQGKVKINIDKVFPFGEIKEAFDYFETAHPQGKVVLSVA